MRGVTAAAAALATAVGLGVLGARAVAARPILYWVSTPPSGAHVLLDGAVRTLRISAAASSRGGRVHLSLVGSTPVSIRSRVGNPATAVLQFPRARDLRLHTFVVTVRARTVIGRRVAIVRTLIVSVRGARASLSGPGPIARWSYVLHSGTARAQPSHHARIVGSLPAITSDSMPNLVRVIAQSRDRSGKLWIQVALTTVPNGRTGWVPRPALSAFHVVRTRLVVDTRRLKLSLFRAGREVFTAPIGVGRAGSPTPRGTFYVRERLSNFHDPFYGPIAFGTNARSPTLTDWPGGGIVGIHGTNAPSLVPGRISHGCVRLRNPDIIRLGRLLPLGTPILIR